MIKIPLRTSSFFAAILGWLLLSALAVFIVEGMRDRARLIRDNENELLFNMLFTGLRGYDDFGSAIEANPALRERIAGFAVYGGNLSLLYSWGRAPASFDESLLGKRSLQGRFGRYTIPDRTGDSVKFILRAEMPGAPPDPPPPPPGPDQPPPPQGGPGGGDRGGRQSQMSQMIQQRREGIMRQGFPFFNTLTRGRYYYIDISHPAYRRTMTLTAILLPLCCAGLLAAALYIRHLYLRNREYRERIEAQKNLVVLGTAAGTLAHEIKNPLSSIRLQTGILRKVFSGGGREEIAIIEEEVDRLSELTYRVNDYLREAAGNPQPIRVCDLLAETGRRLCGRDIMEGGSALDAAARVDPDRFRSVFENLIRNALEAGGPAGAVSAAVLRSGLPGNLLVITISDRGKGLAEADRRRVFDPFFTSKSAGTGIGLSISKRFVEAAGGTISLENREGGGAVLTIILPESPVQKLTTQ